YQVWSASALILGGLGLCGFLPIASLVGWGISRIPRLPQWENASNYTTILLALVFTAIVVRWLIEVRRCRLAQTCFVVASLLGVLSTLQFVSLLHLSSYQIGELITHSLQFAAILVGLAGLFVYGRHVLLDAQGLLGGRVKLKKKKVRAKKLANDDSAIEE